MSKNASLICASLVLIVSPLGYAQNPAATVTVNAAANRHSINPNIYGVAYGTTSTLADLNFVINRYGGNNSSRYNWQINADNRASDWYFESIGDTSAAAGERGDTFFSTSRAGGAQTMLTIPLIGWVAILGQNRNKLSSFSIQKYGAQTGNDWQWFPDAGNGIQSPSGQFVMNNQMTDANVQVDSTYQEAWIQHLVSTWGTAANGGVTYYLLDNEPSIWFSTHRDVHPNGPTMDEMKSRMIDYASKIKAVDPTALVVGPEEWGWSGYFYSGADQQAGPLNNWSSFPDRAAHGNQDYLPWLLGQLKQAAGAGPRLLDVFSVHYYPQGGEFGDDTSTATQLLRNRSTRSLWDPTYVDQSWINDKVQLIPRLKTWVATYYFANTPVAITEYNWGAESHINGATAQADILGIFGREGLDLAARWTMPDPSTPVYKAMKMYRNYDGAKSGFGDTSVSDTVANPDNLSSFAAVRSSDGALTVMVINKVLSGSTPVTVALQSFVGSGTAHVYQLTSANAIQNLNDLTYSGSNLNLTVPPQSITLLIFPKAAASQPALTITKSHSGSFTQGQQNASYTVTVSNAGAGATTGPVTVTENVPSGLTLASMSGTGWTCPGTAANNCTRSDALNGSASYAAITVMVNVGWTASSPQVNSVSVSGGGSVTANTTDSTVITPNPPVLTITKTHSASFTQSQANAIYTVTVSNTNGAGPTSGTVTVTDILPAGLTLVSMSGTGWACPGTQANNCTRSDVLNGGGSYPAITVKVNVAANAASQVTNQASVSGGGAATASVMDNTAIVASVATSALRFIPVAPCRVADTRVTPNGAFSGPSLAAKTVRDFVIPNSTCGIPSTAAAYSLNVTVVPPAVLGFLTVWPSGQPQPLASTLNSMDGRTKANAAIVAAGTNGAVSVYANAATDLVLDIDGYFVPAASAPNALMFYPLTPCRIADTRSSGTGSLGAPSLIAKQSRTFPVQSSSCNIPITAQAYSLNFTAVPAGPLGFLTAWPTGQTQPLASVLNDPTGTDVANAAIIPAGTNGAVDVYANAATDLIIDINGYFAAPATGGLSLCNLTPCRVLDTRVPAGSQPFKGELDVNVSSSVCGVPANAQAYVFNATVVPPAAMGFLTLWPQGTTRPVASTLNALDGQITSNMAIVPTINGSLAAYANAFTHLILDISGYFAP